MNARHRIALLLLALFGPVACAEHAKTIAKQMEAAAAMPFHFANAGEKSVGIWERDQLVLVYNFGEIDSPKGPTTRPHSNYIHPLYGLDGEVLTDDFPTDHVHHRGVYWAWPHVKIGEQQYDLWSLRGIGYKLEGVPAMEIRRDAAVLALENGWFVADQRVMREQVRLTVHPATADSRAIDVELTWTPTDRSVTLWGAEGKSYGGFTMRFAPRKKTIIITPSGEAKDDLVVTKLPWADLSGDFKASPDALSGAAIFIPPDHPDFPPTWMTRHYGMLAVGWPGVTPRTIAPGESVRCRYRLWIHRGNPSAVEIGKAYDQYRAHEATKATNEPTTVP
jgi:hypothetical protein